MIRLTHKELGAFILNVSLELCYDFSSDYACFAHCYASYICFSSPGLPCISDTQRIFFFSGLPFLSSVICTKGVSRNASYFMKVFTTMMKSDLEANFIPHWKLSYIVQSACHKHQSTSGLRPNSIESDFFF